MFIAVCCIMLQYMVQKSMRCSVLWCVHGIFVKCRLEYSKSPLRRFTIYPISCPLATHTLQHFDCCHCVRLLEIVSAIYLNTAFVVNRSNVHVIWTINVDWW